MDWVLKPILWIYDFLAEDIILLAGTAVAILAALALAHANATAAGPILFLVVACIIAMSIWRTVSTSA